ncbi:MAG: type II toxin-antitoxin system VapC family toxin [Archaeoglobaceae archaeon]|nr:type II toxin-antitoxin system VapC family toxin [Archaeoglobaceae archaeon]MDW8014169.1 type II toxin-antitoxin system VapC family toxin [Archaeoglobaceae archaeon]
MKILLDTSFLIELKKGNEKAVKVLKELSEKCEDLLVSTLTVYELLSGANYLWKKFGNARDLLIIQEMLKSLTIVPFEFENARKASEVRAELMLRGLNVPDVDVLIACSEDAKILTFDKDFTPLKDLGFDVLILD